MTLIVCLLLCITIMVAIQVEEGDFRDFLYGSSPDFAYDNWYSHVAENIARPGYNKYSPFDIQTNDFGDFTYISDADTLNWRVALEQFASGEIPASNAILSSMNIPFDVLEIHDTFADREYYVLREIPDTTYYDDNGTPTLIDDEDGAFTYGWGLVVFNPSSPNPAIISVVHPCDDFISVPVAYEAFRRLNARYLIINGVGREVDYTGYASWYRNSRSRSDPSRYTNHPYNRAYRVACNEIRDTFGQSEFALQVHSYDNTNDIQSDIILSTGVNTSLLVPVFDRSSKHLDLINNMEFEIEPVSEYNPSFRNTVLDYCSVAGYSTPPIRYFKENGSAYPITTHDEYYGIDSSFQFDYTTDSNDSYHFKNWLHIEMREEPGYSTNYYDYYNYDVESSSFDWEHRYDNAIEYNSHWISSLANVLPYYYARSDGYTIPKAPSPLTFILDYDHQGEPADIVLNWGTADDYNFERYQVEIAEDSLFTIGYSVMEDISNMNDLDYSFGVDNIEGRRWFRIKAYDYDGLYSFSNILFIDPNLTQEAIGVAPELSYCIYPTTFDVRLPYVDITVENHGNAILEVTGVEGLGDYFIAPEFDLSIVMDVFPMSENKIKICFTRATPGKYKTDLILNTNSGPLLYTVRAIIPEPLNLTAKTELVNRGDSMILQWEPVRVNRPITYEIYYAETPHSEFVLQGSTNQNSYKIDTQRRTGFYKVKVKE